jgi:hypothetical protein
MILARTNGSEQAYAAVSTAAGIAGVISAVSMSIWGGPKKKIRGMLSMKIGAGIAKTVFGLGRTVSVWVPAQFGSSLNFPIMGSSRQSIYLSKIEPDVQGRVLATRQVIMTLVSAIGRLISGPLADGFFEPAMLDGGILQPTLGPVFGSGPGSGMAVVYTLSALMLIVAGVCGYANPHVRNVENILPDHDVEK